MKSRLMLAGIAVVFTATGAFAKPAVSACQSKASPTHEIRKFAQILLVGKNPATAYGLYASPTMIQHNKPFGSSRSSTIKQWLTLTTLPTSSFTITGIHKRGDVFTISFEGRLGPGQAATVRQHDKVACGKIVEEWAEFTVHQPKDKPSVT